MPNYHDFTTARPEPIDWATLTASIRTAVGDPTVAIGALIGTVCRMKRAGPWTAPDLAATQGLLDTAPPLTPDLQAQRAVDDWPIELRALVLALIDQLNTIRAALPSPLPPITPAQALAAIRAKAGTL